MQQHSQPLQFLCDEMLTGLARWLRAAGYDTEVCALSSSDQQVLDKALSDKRILLTRDRNLAQRREAKSIVIHLECGDIESCVESLGDKLPINWLFQPFSRCMQCNSRLQTAGPDKLARVPENSRNLAQPLLYCPQCDKVYWDGSHVDKMRRKLSMWAHQQTS